MKKMSVEQLSKSYYEVNVVFKKFVNTIAEIRAKYSFLNKPVLRVFISVPMNGRTEEAKEAFGKFFGLDFDGNNVEFVNTFIQNEAPDECRNDRIWYLGNSIKVLSTCDIILFAKGWYRARGCEIESRIADSYRIPAVRICDKSKYDKADFEYYSGQLSLFVPDKKESKPECMTEEAYKEWRKVMDDEDRKEWQKVMNEVDGIGQR